MEATASPRPRVMVASPVHDGSLPFLETFLDAWRSIAYPDAEFCLVVNNSSDGTLDRLLSGLPHVRAPGDLRVVHAEPPARPGRWAHLLQAQRRIRDLFLAGPCDRLLINETSRPLRPDTLTRLVAYDRPAIGCLYKDSNKPGYYCVYDFDRRRRRYDFATYARVDRIDEPTPVRGIGFGAILIARDLVERLPFRSEGHAADTYFCEDLKALGIPAYAAPIELQNLKVERSPAASARWDAARCRVLQGQPAEPERLLPAWLRLGR